MYLLFLSLRRSSQTPEPSVAVSQSTSRAASESMNAALSMRTDSSQIRVQKEVPSSFSGSISRKRPTLSLTNPNLPEESKTTMRSGIARKICSFRRRSSFSSLSSSINCFLRLRLSWADRRLAARFCCFLLPVEEVTAEVEFFAPIAFWGKRSVEGRILPPAAAIFIIEGRLAVGAAPFWKWNCCWIAWGCCCIPVFAGLIAANCCCCCCCAACCCNSAWAWATCWACCCCC
mmetsp:Transcript_8778/g.21639  ORF Transcript_8778/g.21639 Transcript_8778/m.21639 type:complete len:232 (-) Transcript_8778:405-1100(-)